MGVVCLYLQDSIMQPIFPTLPQYYSPDINFNRPGFTEMIEVIEAGYIRAILVKDMSWLGRDYLQVGFYTEVQRL